MISYHVGSFGMPHGNKHHSTYSEQQKSMELAKRGVRSKCMNEEREAVVMSDEFLI